MQEAKLDPRAIRTRQLIQNAFRSLIQIKDIKEITIGDITEHATINRATFYAHFADKYELMDDMLTGMFREGIMQKLQCHDEFSLQALTGIIVTMCEFHRDLSTQCQKNYEASRPYMESKIKDLLQEVLFFLIEKSNGRRKVGFETEEARTVSIMLSWSIYGIAYAWNREGRQVSPEELAAQALTALPKVTRMMDVMDLMNAMDGVEAPSR